MKFVPRNDDVTGRYILARPPEESLIVRPDVTKETTKFILVDAVGPVAEAKGIKIGDIVLVDRVWGVKLNGGTVVRALVKEPDCRMFIDDAPLNTFVVQTDSGTKFVPFDHPDAAKAIGGKRPGDKPSSLNGGHEVVGAPA